MLAAQDAGADAEMALLNAWSYVDCLMIVKGTTNLEARTRWIDTAIGETAQKAVSSQSLVLPGRRCRGDGVAEGAPVLDAGRDPEPGAVAARRPDTTGAGYATYEDWLSSGTNSRPDRLARAGRRRTGSAPRGAGPTGTLMAPRDRLTLLYLLLALALPVAILVVYSFWTAGLFQVIREFTSRTTGRSSPTTPTLALAAKTLVVGLVSATLVVFGFTMAYAITFKMPTSGSRMLVLVTGTLLASYLVRIYAWKAILGDQGILNRFLLDVGVINQPLGFLLYGYFAIVLTLVYVYLPFSVLLIYAGMQNVDRRVFEASRDLGASRFRTMRKVTIPLVAPVGSPPRSPSASSLRPPTT